MECKGIPSARVILSYPLRCRFRWVFCQLEVLRHCLPASIRQALDRLPESLDETYVHVLRQIPQVNQAHAHRMLQCLMVAVRPLRVEELAELLAFEFDAAQGGIPPYRAAWRLDDQTQAVLSTCSSLVTIIKQPWSGVHLVQFSHFSVKEFLMSNRLGDFSRYRISLRPAHTVLTQACLGSLLHFDDHKASAIGFPLAGYAARHWVEHAQVEDVVSRVKEGLKRLFDSDKPYFTAWIRIYDIDKPNHYKLFLDSRTSSGISPSPNPLYYSVLCGFYDLVKHLAVKHPEHVNAMCGQYRFPLLAALGKDRLGIMELLLEHGANVNVREQTMEEIILLKVLSSPQRNRVNVVKLLLKHGADVNARHRILGNSSLHLAEHEGELEVAQMLVKHKADLNSQNDNGKTPLHILLQRQMNKEDVVLTHARLLLERGAGANIRDKDNQTPILFAIMRGWFKLTRILLEYGADTNVENSNGGTPLNLLLETKVHGEGDVLDLTRLLLEHDAEVNRRYKSGQTPLLLAMGRHWFKIARILLEHGADANMERKTGKNPLHMLLESRTLKESDALDPTRLLLAHGAEVNRKDKSKQTPLHLAVGRDWFELARILLEHGANANVENNIGKTSLHLLSESRTHSEGDDALDLTRLLLEHGAEVNKQNKNKQTPLHLAIGRDRFKLARILLEHGADANVENNIGKTSLHLLSESRTHSEGDALSLTRFLLEHGVEVNRKDKSKQTPLHLSLRQNSFELAWTLLEHGADANAENNNGETPLHILSEHEIDDKTNAGDMLHHILWLDHGVEVNRGYKNFGTPLLLEIGTKIYKFGWKLLSFIQVLLWRVNRMRPRCSSHKANMAPRNVVLEPHNYYASAA